MQRKAHLISMLAVPAVVTQNCACISAGCYRFCSSAISVMLLSLRLIPRLWQLGLSFWCWFQWRFRTTFILFDTVLFWDLILKVSHKTCLNSVPNPWWKRSLAKKNYSALPWQLWGKYCMWAETEQSEARKFLLLHPECLKVASGKFNNFRDSQR